MTARTIFALALCLSSLTSMAATVAISPLSGPVFVNTDFTVEVAGIGFPATEGGGFSLRYDPLLLEITAVSIDDGLWNFINDDGTTDNAAGALNDVKVSAFPAVDSGDFAVATVGFHARGAGHSLLTLAPAPGNAWASGGNLINPVFDHRATIEIVSDAVPLPAAQWLFLAGLGLLVSAGNHHGKTGISTAAGRPHLLPDHPCRHCCRKDRFRPVICAFNGLY